MNRALLTRPIFRIFIRTSWRKFWAIALCFLALGLAIMAARATLSDITLHDRGVAQGEAAAAFTTDENPIGINIDTSTALEDESASAQDQSIALIKAGGFGLVRQRFPWRQIEPSRDVYEWSKWDNLTADYAAAGLKVVAILDQPPEWSRQDNNWINRPPDSYTDYANFVQAFVARYQGSVGYVEIWDEPNIFPNWGNRAVNPADYVSLLKAAYGAAKTANPNVKVLAAGFAPNTEPGGRNMADTLFLEAIYRAGARNYFDILATKPYGFDFPPDDRRVDDRILNFSRTIRLHEIMVANGDEGKPIWAVEFGWNALPSDWAGPPSPWGRVSESQQADYMARAMARARQEWPWLQGLLIQGFAPRAVAANPVYGFSVVDDGLQPRPVYGVIQRSAEEQWAPVGRHSVDSRYAHYEGDWQAVADGRLGVVGDSITIPFEGTRLDALIERSPSGAAIHVAVDGKGQSFSPDLDSHATAQLYSSKDHQAQLTLASGLTDSLHVAEISVVAGTGAERGGSQALIKGFLVVRDAPFGSDWALLALWLAISVVAFIGLVWATPAVYHTASPYITGTLWGLSAQLTNPTIRLTRRWEDVVDGIRSEGVMVAMAVALAVFYFVPIAPVAVGGLLIFALLAWPRPDLALPFVVFATPFVGLPKELGHLQFTMVEVLIVTIAMTMGLRYTLKLIWNKRTDRSLYDDRRMHGDPHPTPLPLGEGVFDRGSVLSDSFVLGAGIFLVASLVSLVGAERIHEGLRELRTVVVEPMIFYWLVVRAMNGRKAVWLPNALIIAAVVACSLGLYQYLVQGDAIDADGVFRMRAFYGSPNNLGLFLGRTLPFVLSLGLVGAKKRGRLLYLAAAPLLVISLVLTFSSGAWLGIAAAMFVMLALRSVRQFGLAAIGTAGLAAALPQVVSLERFTSRLDLVQGTAGMRLMIWQAASNMLADHPLLGVGLDNFLYQYPRYMLSGAWREPNLSHPHNLVLDFWLRTGLLGLAAAGWLIVRFFVGALRILRQSDDARSQALTLGLLGSMTDFLVHGMIDNAYFTIDLAIIFWASLAAVRLLEGEREQA